MENGKNGGSARIVPVASHHLSQLERQLKTEIDLQVRYAAALEEENKLVRKFKKDQIDDHVESRGAIAEKIELAAKQREILRQTIDPSNTMTITEILNQRVSKSDRIRLLKLANTLRSLVQGNRTRGEELGRLVQFTQTLVDGSIAIFRSASQPVMRSYGRNRATIERDAPKNRGGLKITEA
jgi:hypothetical protein